MEVPINRGRNIDPDVLQGSHKVARHCAKPRTSIGTKIGTVKVPFQDPSLRPYSPDSRETPAWLSKLAICVFCNRLAVLAVDGDIFRL